MKVKHKYKLGQIVEITGVKNAHQFIIGEYVQINKLLGNHLPYYRCSSINVPIMTWLVMEDNIKEILNIPSKRIYKVSSKKIKKLKL